MWCTDNSVKCELNILGSVFIGNILNFSSLYRSVFHLFLKTLLKNDTCSLDKIFKIYNGISLLDQSSAVFFYLWLRVLYSALLLPWIRLKGFKVML